MISNAVSPRLMHLGLAVILGFGLAAVSLPALAGVGEGEPSLSLRGAEAAGLPQVQLGDEGAWPASKAGAPIVVADKVKVTGENRNKNKNWNKNSNQNVNITGNNKYKNKNWNKNYNNNVQITGNNKCKKTTGTRTTGTRMSMCGLGNPGPITANSSAASFLDRS